MSYSVQVTITSVGATYNLQVAQGDDVPGNVAPAYGLADPLTITQKLQDNPRGILAHPEPEEATVNLIAPDSTTYAALAIGDPIAVKVYPAAAFAGTPVEFYGRVADINGQPHDLGVQVTLSCIDYTADLAAVSVGGVANYPVEMALDRINRMWDELALPHAGRTPPAWVLTTSPLLAARTAGWTDLYSLLVATLDSWTFRNWKDQDQVTLPLGTGNGHTTSYRVYLVQNITAGLLDTTSPYLLRVGRPWARRVTYDPPLHVVNVAGVRKVTTDVSLSSPASGSVVLDAGLIEMAPMFGQHKGDILPNVTIGTDAQGNRYTWDWRAINSQWATGGAVFAPGGWQPTLQQLNPQGPPVVQELDTVLDVTDAGLPSLSPSALVMDYRVPFRPDTRSSWAVGTMAYQAWKEATPWRRPELTELVTVARGAAGRLPNNREWVSGHVVSTVLTISKGRPVITIDTVAPSWDFVANREQLGASAGVCSLNAPVLAGVTLAQLNARDTLNDYALTRGS